MSEQRLNKQSLSLIAYKARRQFGQINQKNIFVQSGNFPKIEKLKHEMCGLCRIQFIRSDQISVEFRNQQNKKRKY